MSNAISNCNLIVGYLTKNKDSRFNLCSISLNCKISLQETRGAVQILETKGLIKKSGRYYSVNKIG